MGLVVLRDRFMEGLEGNLEKAVRRLENKTMQIGSTKGERQGRLGITPKRPLAHPTPNP